MNKWLKFTIEFLCWVIIPVGVLLSSVAFAELSLTVFDLTTWSFGERLILAGWIIVSLVICVANNLIEEKGEK